MKQITINDYEYAVTIHQQDESLPYLLMLHGFMGDQRVFSHLIDGLNNFCNPITIDLLGFGKSSKPIAAQNYHEVHQVDALHLLIQKIDASPLFLYGYSMGGRLSLQLISNHSDLCVGLILESANAGIADPQQRKERKKIDTIRAQKIKHNFSQFLAHWKKLDLFKSPNQSNKTLLQQYHKIQAEQSPPALAASLKGFGTGSMSPLHDNLKNIILPTLLIAGSADKKYQHINQYLSKQLPNATFESIKAGHRVHLDNPDTLIKKLDDFIVHN